MAQIGFSDFCKKDLSHEMLPWNGLKWNMLGNNFSWREIGQKGPNMAKKCKKMNHEMLPWNGLKWMIIKVCSETIGTLCRFVHKFEFFYSIVKNVAVYARAGKALYS